MPSVQNYILEVYGYAQTRAMQNHYNRTGRHAVLNDSKSPHTFLSGTSRGRGWFKDQDRLTKMATTTTAMSGRSSLVSSFEVPCRFHLLHVVFASWKEEKIIWRSVGWYKNLLLGRVIRGSERRCYGKLVVLLTIECYSLERSGERSHSCRE